MRQKYDMHMPDSWAIAVFAIILALYLWNKLR
jgi:cbb3-type cytochrome oxidase subunit 3